MIDQDCVAALDARWVRQSKVFCLVLKPYAVWQKFRFRSVWSSSAPMPLQFSYYNCCNQDRDDELDCRKSGDQNGSFDLHQVWWT